jgi:hypothetical protein
MVADLHMASRQDALGILTVLRNGDLALERFDHLSEASRSCCIISAILCWLSAM